LSDLKDDILDDLSSIDVGVKERHGCVTAWLVLVIMASILGCIGIVFSTTDLGTGSGTPDVEGSLIWVLAAIAMSNAFFAYLILRWRKNGFFAFAVSTTIVFCINLYYELSLYESVSAFFGLGILYAILQIKNRFGRTAWELLE